MSRLVLLLLYVSFLGSTWIVEQPMTSLLWEHPRMRWLASTVKARSVCVLLPCILHSFVGFAYIVYVVVG
jgi:hypothetical protein